MAKKKAALKQRSKRRSGKQPRKKAITRKRQNVITRFYRETVGELRKVSWPTWPEAKRLTGIVIAVIFVMASFLAIMDFLFAQIFALILGS